MEGPTKNTPELSTVRNVQPQGRHMRSRCREVIEKKNLKQRDFGYVRYPSEVIDEPFAIPSESVGYLSSADRFHSDVVGEFKAERDAEIKKKDEKLAAKRADSLRAEEMRWEKIQDERRQERNRITEARDQMVLNPRNNSNSVPYNPVTLEYNDTLEGARLQQKHEFVKYRAIIRSKNLHDKSSCGYNPITGEDMPGVHVPDPPYLPSLTITPQSDDETLLPPSQANETVPPQSQKAEEKTADAE